MFPYRRLPSHITGLYIFTVINFLILCHMALVQADISVISLKTNETVVPFMADMPAYFGGHIGYDGIWGQTVYSDPANACLEIQPPPKNSTIEIPGVKWFVLIVRGSCTFSKKVLNAQEAGYDVAIVHNLGSNQLEPMGPDKEKGITIPSVFIGESDGMSIKKLYTYDKGFLLYINDDFPDPFWSGDLNKYLMPFVFLLAICFIAVTITVIIKCVRDRNRRRRHRLPTRLLRQLPIKKFKKNDPYDMCAICLDEYIEGEKLRVLPCNHTYHTKCIDPWLTESRRTCPVCKRKVLPRTNRNRRRLLSSLSGTDSESDSDRDSDGGSGQANEHTPLLAPESRGNINLGERDMGRTNQSVIWDEESTGNSPTPTLPRSVQEGVPSTSSSPGGRYQSFTPTYSIGNLSLAGMLLFPPNNPANELLSSGEHSLNGEVTDFAPVETQPLADESENQSRGPVEIAVDVATRGTSASLWGTSPTSQRNTSSRGDCDLVV